jgi:hypothetical protein
VCEKCNGNGNGNGNGEGVTRMGEGDADGRDVLKRKEADRAALSAGRLQACLEPRAAWSGALGAPRTTTRPPPAAQKRYR